MRFVTEYTMPRNTPFHPAGQTFRQELRLVQG